MRLLYSVNVDEQRIRIVSDREDFAVVIEC